MFTNDELLNIALRYTVAARTNAVRSLPRAGKIRFGVPGVEGLTAVGFSLPLDKPVEYPVPACVYILTSYEFPVYVGQTTNLVNRLSSHQAPEAYERGNNVRRGVFDGVIGLVVEREMLLPVEAALINLFRPLYNVNIPAMESYRGNLLTWRRV